MSCQAVRPYQVSYPVCGQMIGFWLVLCCSSSFVSLSMSISHLYFTSYNFSPILLWIISELLRYYYRISSVIRHSFFLPKQSQTSLGLFWKGKAHIIVKFHGRDVVICSHSREGRTSSYSQINIVMPADVDHVFGS